MCMRMHTHFGSITFALSTFLSVVLVGSAWRVFWINVMGWGVSRNSPHLVGFAKAALGQY